MGVIFLGTAARTLGQIYPCLRYTEKMWWFENYLKVEAIYWKASFHIFSKLLGGQLLYFFMFNGDYRACAYNNYIDSSAYTA